MTKRKDNITIDKEILSCAWYSDISTVRLFLHLSLTVNKNGEREVSLATLAKETSLSLQQVRTAVKKLESTHYLTRLATRSATRSRHGNLGCIKLKSQACQNDSNTVSNTVINTVSNTVKTEPIPPKKYGNQDVNLMLKAMKSKIGITHFVDSSIERNIAKHLVVLLHKIGKEEFLLRLEYLLNDNFHIKNCNKIKYIYNNLKGFLPTTKQNNNHITL